MDLRSISLILIPSIKTSPCNGAICAARVFNSVDFPAPFGPHKTVVAPLFTANDSILQIGLEASHPHTSSLAPIPFCDVPGEFKVCKPHLRVSVKDTRRTDHPPSKVKFPAVVLVPAR